MNSVSQRLFCADHHQDFLCSGDTCIDKISLQHNIVAHHDRHHNDRIFWSLRLMYRRGICLHHFVQFCDIIFNRPAVISLFSSDVRYTWYLMFRIYNTLSFCFLYKKTISRMQLCDVFLMKIVICYRLAAFELIVLRLWWLAENSIMPVQVMDKWLAKWWQKAKWTQKMSKEKPSKNGANALFYWVFPLARPKELESPTFCSGGRRSIQLSYGRIFTWQHGKNITKTMPPQESSFMRRPAETLKRECSSHSGEKHDKDSCPG